MRRRDSSKSLSELGLTESDIVTTCKVLSTLPVGSALRVPHIDVTRVSVSEFSIQITDNTDEADIYDNPLFKNS